MKKIHFVCLGNTFRSRMAEAYFNSLKLENWQASSSGMEAAKNKNGTITIYAKNILEEHNILKYTKNTWTQTTKEILEEQDLVVFMHHFIYELCKERINPNLSLFEVWQIEDINDEKTDKTLIPTIADQTFIAIKKKVNDLIKNFDYK